MRANSATAVPQSIAVAAPFTAPPLDSAESRALYGLLSSSLRAAPPSSMSALETMNERLRAAATARAQEQVATASGLGVGGRSSAAAYAAAAYTTSVAAAVSAAPAVSAPAAVSAAAASRALPPPPHFSPSFSVRAVGDATLSAALRLPADRAGALALPAVEGARVRIAGWRGSLVVCGADGVALRTAPQPLLLAALETLSLLPVPTGAGGRGGGPSRDLSVTQAGSRAPFVASLVHTHAAHIKVRSSAEGSGSAALSWAVGADINAANKLTGEAPLCTLRSCVAVGSAALSVDFSIILPLRFVLASREGTLAQLAAVLGAMGPVSDWPALGGGTSTSTSSAEPPLHAVAGVALTLYFASSGARDDWAAALSFLASIEEVPLGARLTVRGGALSGAADPPFAPADADSSDDDDDGDGRGAPQVTAQAAAVIPVAVPIARRAPPVPPAPPVAHVTSTTTQAFALLPAHQAYDSLPASGQLGLLPAALAALEGAFDLRIDPARLGPLLRASRRDNNFGPPTSDEFLAPPMLV